MSNRKGGRFERELVQFLKENGFPHAERRALRGADDRGDIVGIPGLVIEAKSHNRLDLPGWLDQLREEKERDGGSDGAVIARRRNHWIGKSYFVMDAIDGIKMLRRLGYGLPLEEDDE